jgi:hypothetical protein
VKDRSNRDGECPVTIPALPAHGWAVTAGVTTDLVAFTIGAHGMSFPADAFKVINGFLLGLKGLEDFENVHGGNLRKTSSVSLLIYFLSSPKAYYCVKKLQNGSSPVWTSTSSSARL